MKILNFNPWWYRNYCNIDQGFRLLAVFSWNFIIIFQDYDQGCIKSQGPGFSPGYFCWKIEEKKNQKKSLAVWFPPTRCIYQQLEILVTIRMMIVLWFVNRNRPFYRYSGHIELIRCKEYYRMSRGHEHVSFVFSSAFRNIFS